MPDVLLARWMDWIRSDGMLLGEYSRYKYKYKYVLFMRGVWAGFVCSTLAAIRLVNLFRIFPFHFTPLDVALICGDSLCLAVRS